MAEITSSAGRAARYSTVAIILHWVIAAAIVLQIVLVDRMEGRSPQAFAIFQLHKSVGITVLLLSLARLAWRLANPPPPLPAEMSKWEKLAAQITHIGFYVVMIGMPITGWIIVSTSRIQIPTLLFGAVPWPHIPGLEHLTGDSRKLWHEIGETSHGLIIKGFYVLAALHVLGALKHQFTTTDGVLGRMAPGAKPGRKLEPALLAIAIGFGIVFAFGKLVQPPLTATSAPPAKAVETAAPAPEPEVSAAAPEAASPAEAAPATPEAAPAEPVAWKIQSGSTLAFETTWGGEPVKGTFGKWTGDILFSPEALDKSKVVISIDMTSAQSGDSQRDSELAGEEFFDSPAHPKATFTATKFEKVSEGRFVARGTLDLRGVKKPVSLPFRLQITGDKASVSGVTSLDRTSFGIGQGEWQSTDQIPAKVTVRVDLKARR